MLGAAGSRSDGRLAARKSVLARFLMFLTHLQMDSCVATIWDAIPHIPEWILSLNVQPRTAKNYLSALTTVATRISGLTAAELNARFPELPDTQAVLSRAQPFTPVKRAKLANTTDVMTLLEQEPQGRGLLAALMWFAAARFSDLHLLCARHFLLDPRRRRVRVHLFRTKTDQSGLGRFILVQLPTQVFTLLDVSLRGKAPDDRWMNITYPRMYPFLKEQGLTAHSFRRGAINAALDAGVTPEQLMLLTGHKTREALLRYAETLARSDGEAHLRSLKPLLYEWEHARG